MSSTILITIYDNPDKFPPTLNAIYILSKKYRKVIIVWRGNPNIKLNLPDNCIHYCVSSGNLIDSSYFIKIYVLIKFLLSVIKHFRNYRPKWLVSYDCYSFTAALFVKLINKHMKIWYHNHDITDTNYVTKYSLTYWCWLLEKKYINKVTSFTVPDESRLKYFYLNEYVNTKVIPNYPLKSFNDFFNYQTPSTFKILYQGRVANGHGIIELIKFIHSNPQMAIQFDIIGSYDDDFKESLISLIKNLKLQHKVILHERIPNYKDLKNFTKNFHIGLGIMEPLNLQFQTCAKASNKIYEYIAFGMPVILFDNAHFKSALSQYQWAHFTDMSEQSFKSTLTEIMDNFEFYSKYAYNDFRNKLNFETVFADQEKFLS
ncbi:glycosyltransferase [Pedobacter helvus]|uniref:Glycosyltransferase n=1 Tax=Pedobacter helvus TaxID=2563444 RepID=A0ABW9JL20_9SPHI|nr:glycosyltransferase [Pedobacter ureilyticus]